MEFASLSVKPHRRHRPWIWALSGLIAAIVIFVVMLAAAVPLSSDAMRRRITSTLSERLDSDVSLGDLTLRVFPRLHAEGSALVIREHGRSDVPPLISVKAFSVDADLLGLLRKHVAHVQLVGLDIEIPPGRHDDHDSPSAEPKHASSSSRTAAHGVVVDAMDSTDARLALIPSHPGKAPRVWNIHTLRLTNVGADQAMPYDATLRNAVPPGEIVANGHFGPWQRDEPGDTPLDGRFTFDRADLSVFHGISGMLSSRGSFGGTLARIDANGETDTPDFTIRIGGHPFALHTKYHAIIDGTNGNTMLEQIEASFLQSTLVAHGGVVDENPGEHGRTVRLQVRMDKARIEDVMKMAVKTPQAPMTGALGLTTGFVLPPGESDVSERLQLDGRFGIDDARFASYDVQKKINELSHRGRGRKPDAPASRVLSDFSGRFRLADGRLRLPALQFAVPGAMVKLAGQYALKPETLDFKGSLLMDASVSETQTGFKSMLLKMVDPLFKPKDGTGSSIPIKVGGTRSAPDFGLDVRRVFHKEG